VQLREFNAPLIAHYTDMLNPDNMRVILVQQDFDIELPETEPYMGAAYRIDAIPSELLDDLHGELVYEGLHMPGRNRFIPKSLEVQRPAVLPVPAKEPTLLKQNDGIELWFKRDDQFFLPRGDITLNIEVPKLGRSPRMTVMGYIYEYIVYQALQKDAFGAGTGGVYYSIDMGYEGIYLTVYGLSDKLPLLLDTVLKALKSTKVDQKLLDAAKVLHLDHFKNKLNDSASVYAAREIQYMSYTPDWMPKAILREIDSITVDKIQEFADTLFDSSRVKMLVVGNHSEQEALDIGDMVIDALGCTPLPQHLRTARQTHWIEAGSYLRQIVGSAENSSNSAVNLRIYMRDLPDIKSQAMGPLFSQIMYRPFFSQLRTKEQLGYSLDASCYMMQQYSHRILQFELMGESNPAYLLLRIRQFLQGFRAQLVEMDEGELTGCIETLAESWIEKKRNQTQEGTRFWSCITSGYYMFDIDERYAESLKGVTRDDLVEFWDKHLNPDTVQDCTEIAVQVWSPKLPMPATEDVARYPATAIALHQCLQQDNATELSLDAVHRLVDGIAASSDEPFDTLLARCVDMAKRGIEDGFSSKTLADIDAMSSKLSEPGSRVRTALAMAVEHAATSARRTNGFVKGHSRLRISEFGDFRNIGMLPSPDNVWVVPDSLAFKNAQTLLGLPVPAQRLVPKYQ
ncbi:metalloprotease, partial [Linderina pennispora]